MNLKRNQNQTAKKIKNEHEKIKKIFDKTQKTTKPYVRLLTTFINTTVKSRASKSTALNSCGADAWKTRHSKSKEHMLLNCQYYAAKMPPK